MILIADSGSTKTDWCVVENGVLLQQIFTKGTKPFFQSEEEISNEIATALLPQLKTSELDAVYFYGAGCGFPDKISMVHRAITDVYKRQHPARGAQREPCGTLRSRTRCARR